VTTILLARHGETDWNVQNRWQGHADTPLNERGRAQARALAERLAGTVLEAIYSSDLLRASETAGIVAQGRGLTVQTDRRLREIDVGAWQGLTGDEVAERFPDGVRPDGESLEAFQARVVGALSAIGRSHNGATVLVVAHGGCARTLQRHLLGEPLPTLANCGVYPIAFEGGLLRPID
jgi:broad specificity phosphatase PhoE